MTCAVESSAYRVLWSPPLGACRRCHAMPCMHSTTIYNLAQSLIYDLGSTSSWKRIHPTKPKIINPPRFRHTSLESTPSSNRSETNKRTPIQQRPPHHTKMTLTDANRCQICGDALFHDDVYSDPSQHFCISIDGPAMTNNNSHVDSSHEVCSRTKTAN